MPFLAIICLGLVLFIVSRFFGAGGGFCGKTPADRDSGIEELKREIKTMRDEIKELENKDKKGD